MEDEDRIRMEDVEAVSETLSGLVCRLRSRTFEVPRRLVLRGSEVRTPGDRGTLVIPRWYAATLTAR
jgi:hypothetical protein